MKLEELTEVVARFAGGLPKPIGMQLRGVDVILCETPDKATAELQEIVEGDDGGAMEPIAADCKGVFIGEPLEREDSDDTEEMETIALPEGVIAMVASNIQSPEEGVLVLLHEIGHALGMDEEEVKQLGLGVAEAPQQTAAPPQQKEQGG